MSKIERCRVCSSDQLETVLDLGRMANCGVFPQTPAEDPPKTPVVLVQCGDCGLAQLLHTADPADVFGQGFGYRSSTNVQMRMHLEGIAKRLYGVADLRPGETVVDIGSNDGFFLSCLPETVHKVGIDPTASNYARGYPHGSLVIPKFFDIDTAGHIGAGKAKAVTTIAMFYDVPDPNAFVESVKYILAGDGVWFLEQAYLPRMLETGAFDAIVHEHLMYFDIASLWRLLSQHDLYIYDFGFNDVNGGSSWLTVGKDRSRKVGADRLAKQMIGERQGVDFAKFRARIDHTRTQTKAFLALAKAKHKTVHGLGASTKFNCLLQYFGIGQSDLPYIADPNPDKVGRLTPGTMIPIISEDTSREMKPDYYLVGPWHFRDSIIARETDYLIGGGQLVFPLPEFSIVSAKVNA